VLCSAPEDMLRWEVLHELMAWTRADNMKSIIKDSGKKYAKTKR
jgi:hypothetical protein